MKAIRMVKIKENIINWKTIIFISKDVRSIEGQTSSKFYNYEYLCICVDDAGIKHLETFNRRDFEAIEENYEIAEII